MRSSKWISTSIPKEERLKGGATYASASYFINNFMSPVHFYEALQEIPSNAVVVEIAPHSLLQSILKRALPSSIVNVGLTKRKSSNEVETLLCQLGKLYNAGINMDLSRIFPSVEFPISVGTPMISPLVTWDHSYKWNYPKWESVINEGTEVIELDLNQNENEYLKELLICGKRYIPTSLYLWLVWVAFIKKNNFNSETVPVKFDHVLVKKEIETPRDGILTFKIKILEETGDFEVSQGDFVVTEGEISVFESLHVGEVDFDNESLAVTREEVYQELSHRGCQYGEHFQNIVRSNVEYSTGELDWNKNWVTFIETHIQFGLLTNYMDFLLPNKFISITIDPTKMDNDHSLFKIKHCRVSNVISSKGIVITGMEGSKVLQRGKHAVLRKTLVPYTSKQQLSLSEVMSIFLQIIVENGSPSVQIIENPGSKSILTTQLFEASQVLPHIAISQRDPNNKSTTVTAYKKSPLKVNFTSDFVIVEINVTKESVSVGGYNTLSTLRSEGKQYCLLRKVSEERDPTVIPVDTKGNKGLSDLLTSLESTQAKSPILLVSQNGRGPLQHLNPLRLPPNVRIFSILDEKAPRFSPKETTYIEQIKRGARLNVLSGGVWCSYRYLNGEKNLNAIENKEVIPRKENGLNFNSASKLDIHYISINSERTIKGSGDTDLMKQKCIGFSGIDKGAKVMGILHRSCRHCNCALPLLWKVPHQWSLADVASVPLDYTLAYYALAVRGEVKPKQSILISTQLGFALASTAVAIELECRVFVMVDSHFHKEQVLSLFPQVPERSIILMEEVEQKVVLGTDGHGVDLLLNSSEIGWHWDNVLADDGVLIQIAHHSPNQNTEVDLNIISPNRRLEILNSKNLTELLDNEQELEILRALIANGIQKGTVRPLSSNGGGKTDKPEVSRSECERQIIKLNTPLGLPKLRFGPMISFDPNKSYMIIGIFNKALVTFIDWMITRGANRLSVMLTCEAKRLATLRQRRWKRKGIRVTFQMLNGSSQNKTRAQEILDASDCLGGIFDLSMASLLSENEEVEHLKRLKQLMPQLDELLRKRGVGIDMVIFMSHGNEDKKGRSERNVFSAEVERLCEMRKENGLHGLAVQCGTTEWSFSIKEDDTGVCLMDKVLAQRFPIMKLVSYTPLEGESDYQEQKYDGETNERENSDSPKETTPLLEAPQEKSHGNEDFTNNETCNGQAFEEIHSEHANRISKTRNESKNRF